MCSIYAVINSRPIPQRILQNELDTALGQLAFQGIEMMQAVLPFDEGIVRHEM